jgi:microcystin-dependent protein
MSDPFIAEIRMLGFTFAPRGWLFCNGQLISIAQNTALFSLLGTTFGGNGTTNFGIPNLQGRTPIGARQGPGLSNYVLGQSGGAATHPLSVAELPAHTHALAVVAAADGGADRANARGNVLAKPSDSSYTTAATDTTMAPATVSVAGAGIPHNNMQPYVGIYFCIAVQGVYPSRN